MDKRVKIILAVAILFHGLVVISLHVHAKHEHQQPPYYGDSMVVRSTNDYGQKITNIEISQKQLKWILDQCEKRELENMSNAELLSTNYYSSKYIHPTFEHLTN
jgi:hypothetical protein